MSLDSGSWAPGRAVAGADAAGDQDACRWEWCDFSPMAARRPGRDRGRGADRVWQRVVAELRR